MTKHKLPEYIEYTGELCEYGCGQVAHYQFTTGTWCCSERYHKCPAKRKVQSVAQKGRDDLIESGRRMGKSNIGRKSSFEVRQKLSAIQKNLAKHPEESKRRRQQQLDFHERMTEEEKIEYALKRTRSLSRLKKTYPLLVKVEDLRYKPGFEKNRIIQGRCKNHSCVNSKENNGWFDLNGKQLEQRGYVLSLNMDGGYLYCSEECKQSCILYGKSVKQLMCITEYKDITTSPEYSLFRKIVLEREQYKCQFCEEPATIVHHEKPKKTHPHMQLDPDNGISCCVECHKKYGHEKGTECSTGNLANKICVDT